jgi:Sugar phosphate permease
LVEKFLSFLRSAPKAVWLISANHCCVDLTAGAFPVALLFVKTNLALTYTELTAIVLVQSLTSSIVQPLFGYFSDKNPKPWFMPVGALLTGITMPLILLSNSYPLIFLLTALNGLGSAAFHPLGAKSVNLVSSPTGKGKSLSIFSVGGSSGLVLGSLFITLLLKFGIGIHLWLYTLPSLLVAFSMFRLIPTLPAFEPQSKAAQKSSLAGFFSLSILAFLGMMLARATITSGINTFAPQYYVANLGGDPLIAGILLSVFLGAGVAGTLLGGLMSDRYGSRQVMLYSMLPICLTLYLFQISSGIGLFISLGITSILLAATTTSSLVLIQRLMPNNLAMASGINLGFSSGLSALGVLALGAVADHLGLDVVFIILTALPVWGFIMTLLIKEEPPKYQEIR